MDRNVEPNREVPKWSETRWSGCWNPDEGVGLYLHMGRARKDLDLWWVQTVAYLPEGRLVVDRSYGRQPDDAFIRTGNFELAQRENGWSSSFDGAGELTTSEALSAGPRGAGAPAVPITWEVAADAVSPVWDMYGGESERHQFAGDTHVQQAYSTSGSMTVGGETYRLDGVGYKDHSSGVRAWDGYGRHHFVAAHMPDWTLHAIMLHSPEEEPRGPIGAFFIDGEQVALERSELASIEDAFGGPNECEMTVKPASGEEVTLQVEVLHQCPITITDEGDNVNGIDWEVESDAIVIIMEAAARLTDPDGKVGYAFFERGILREKLERPAARELEAQAAGVEG